MTAWRLHWAIAESLVAYVAALDDGTAVVSDGASGDLATGFAFPVAHAEWDAETLSGVLETAGTIDVRGHGVSICAIRAPRLTVTDGVGELSVQRWPGRDARLTLAELGGATPATDGTGWTFADVRLHDDGREIFDFRYDRGKELAPIRLESALTGQNVPLQEKREDDVADHA